MNKRLSYIIFFIPVLVGVMISCEKEPFTKPVNVSCQFLFDERQVSTKSVDVNNNNTETIFREGSIVVKSIEFEGYREEGDDVFFTTDFDHVRGDLLTGSTSPPVNFDIPQGIYTHIEITLELDTLENKPALEIGGTVKDPSLSKFIHGPKAQFTYKLGHKEMLHLNAKSKDSTANIVIKKEDPPEIKILIDPVYLFRDAVNNFEDIEFQDITSDPRIKINKEENDVIYSTINTKLEKGTRAMFY